MTAQRTERAQRADEWRVAAVDVQAYLDRVGHAPVTAPTAAALASLHAAHVRTIPFENVDVVLGRHGGLEPEVLAAKLVGRRRGGYCYEHALLFAAVLERLGYGVERRMARVDPDRFGARTHLCLAVHAEDESYLADVGFGFGLERPLPLRDGAEDEQSERRYRLTREDGWWRLHRRTADGWGVLHAADATPQHRVDAEVAHHYVSTHPHSPFTGQVVVMRLVDGVSRRLVGRELTVERPGGGTERHPVRADELPGVLHDLDVELTAEEAGSLVAAVAGRS